jgi:hypothetical protein
MAGLEMGQALCNGLPDRNRTCDPQLRRLLLYPTELRADAQTQKALMGLFKVNVEVHRIWAMPRNVLI